MYTKYLLQRIERQKQEDQKRKERLAKKLAKKVSNYFGSFILCGQSAV